MADNQLVDESTSDSSPHILLHPLVLIALDDHATRGAIRKQGPVVGALLGRYDGKEISVEQAFECGSGKLQKNDGAVLLDTAWFQRMIKLQLEIYPGLSLVGWYTFGTEPQRWHTALQSQLRNDFECDSPILLLYRPDILQDGTVGGKLPFSLYETVPLPDTGEMEVDGSSSLRLRPITFALETAPDEAIGLADVMQGATTANALPTTQSSDTASGKKRAKEDGQEKSSAVQKATVSPEEEELLAALHTKSDAVKMLQSRLDIIIAYLKSQPASYLSDTSINPGKPKIDHEIMRSISAIAAELNLTSPAQLLDLNAETDQSKTDGKVIELLAKLTQSAGDIKQLGKRAGKDAQSRRLVDSSNSGAGNWGKSFSSEI